jgi:secreted trypsin-like serine protease
MKKTLLVLVSFSLLISGSNVARAVENGADASGNPFVVPISTNISSTQSIGCSGTLIAPTIVVTAGHCVLDANGVVSKEVYVGQAGSSENSIVRSDLASSIEITSNFRNSANNTVGDDDLAFIVLGKPQVLTTPIRLASEAEVTSFRSSGAPLKAIGYGYYSDGGTEAMSFPKSFMGIFSTAASAYTNSAYLQSPGNGGNACSGDSGGPILVSTSSTVILVGVLTGGARSVKCTKKATDGTYYTLFTLISRYSNLAFASALTSINSLQSNLSSAQATVSDLNGQVSSATNDLATVQNSLDVAQSDLVTAGEQIVELQAQIVALQAKIPSTITCIKGKLTQKVTAVTPKCPVGYKLKV